MLRPSSYFVVRRLLLSAWDVLNDWQWTNEPNSCSSKEIPPSFCHVGRVPFLYTWPVCTLNPSSTWVYQTSNSLTHPDPGVGWGGDWLQGRLKNFGVYVLIGFIFLKLSVLTVECWRMVNLNKELGNEGHMQKNWPSHSSSVLFIRPRRFYPDITRLSASDMFCQTKQSLVRIQIMIIDPAFPPSIYLSL